MYLSKNDIEKKYGRLAGYEFGKVFPSGLEVEDWSESSLASLIPSGMGGFLNKFIEDFKLELYPVRHRFYTDEYFKYDRDGIVFVSNTFQNCYFYRTQFTNCAFMGCTITFGERYWETNKSDTSFRSRFDGFFVNCDFAGSHIVFPDYDARPGAQRPAFLDCKFQDITGGGVPPELVFTGLSQKPGVVHKCDFYAEHLN